MKTLIAVLIVAAGVLLPEIALAGCADVPINTAAGAAFTTQDISGGAVTTGEVDTNGIKQLKISVDIADPTPGITKIALTFTESDVAGGTFRKVPFCQDAAPTLTCGPMSIEWNPTADGLTWSVPIPWTYRKTKITVTPTGAGASDTVTLTALGCN